MEENKIIKVANIIIYDTDNIEYISGTVAVLDIDYNNIEIKSINDMSSRLMPISRTLTAQMPVIEETETIKLDETLMRRIAKYNKEVEIKKLDKIIEEKKKQVEELDNNLKDKEKRWKKVKEFVANIYEIELEDEEEDYYYDEEDIY